MTTYSDTVTIGDARAQYFAENNFGDGGYTASWVMAVGLMIAPQAIYRAFMRGRYTKNLYQEEFTEGLLSPTVGNLRQRLRLTAPLPQPTLSDHIAFVGWAGTSVLTLVLSLVVVLVPIVGLAMLIF